MTFPIPSADMKERKMYEMIVKRINCDKKYLKKSKSKATIKGIKSW
jgi:hypothetical protein